MKSEDLKKLSDPIPINQVDFRVGLISASGWMTTLAYKNARVDMDRLDSICGPENWQRDHKEIKGNLFCGVAIKINNRWAWKWDAGSESNMEKEKGEASDSFKRACVNWGLGRDLYSYPLILIQLKPNEFKKYKNTKGKEVGQATYDLRLKEWSWSKDGDNITAKDESGAIRWEYKNGRGYGKLNTSATPPKTTKEQTDDLDLQIAITAINGSKTLEDLQKNWKDYKQFQSVFTFSQAKDKKKIQLTPKS